MEITIKKHSLRTYVVQSPQKCYITNNKTIEQEQWRITICYNSKTQSKTQKEHKYVESVYKMSFVDS